MSQESFESATPVDSAFAGRVPPHSIEAEEYLLSCCLLDGGHTVSRCLEEKLPGAAFYMPANRVVFEQLVQLFAAGKPPIIENLILALQTSRQLEAVGGIAYLMQVSSRISSTIQAGEFIAKLKELYLLRELIKFGSEVVEQSFAYTGGIDDFMGSATTKLLALQGFNVSEKSWPQAIDDAEREAESLAHTNKPVLGELPWGFSDFDRYFLRPRTGQLVMIGARPSVGKSSLMRQIARAMAVQGYDTLIISLEVRAAMIAHSLAQTTSRISYASLRQRTVSPADATAYIESLRELRKIPCLHVTEAAALSSAGVVAKVRALKARRPLKAVFIDHLGLLTDATATRTMSKNDAIDVITKSLKTLAMSEDICVFLLCQLNRASSKEHNREPSLHDLRDSGALEANADKVVLLHRPNENPVTGAEQYENARLDDQPSFYLNAIQAKGRDDGTSSVALNFQRNIASFLQVQRDARQTTAPSL